ncbi:MULTISPECIES: ABC transporter permease [unclassified Caulobacter]|uniref:ABC transporter permease n=1 Tax=unclassified Caulobacter TaxID=2648921 RepID=UPI0006F5F7ED|nr:MULTISPECIES: ABC transporter permease [unclassified Caulobacter]KQV57799.1 ABC transporter [Caulobacter sp. Root342]KQV67371.1 ABC transporter [Caulobacter sp. Root343]
MHTLLVYVREARAQIVSTWHTPQFLIPSVALPLLFYGVMGLGLSKGREEIAHMMLANYVIFAAIAPAMFGFGAAVAAEREAKLIELKQIAPLPAGGYLAGRLAAALALVASAIGLLGVLAYFGGVVMVPWRWAATLGLGLASAVPFALIGLNIGLRLGSQGATAVANLLFLGFCLFGGLWMPLSLMPGWVAKIAEVTPSYHLGQLSMMLSGMAPMADVQRHVSVLAAISLAAMIGAWAGWRRQTA